MKEKRVFTDEELDYILDNWGKMNVHSIARELHTSWNSIARLAEGMGLEVPRNNYWTEGEIELLRHLAEEMPYQEMTKYIHRPAEAIREKANDLGIVLKHNIRIWTPEEEDLLKFYWGHLSYETISKNMNRSIESLKKKAKKLGLENMMKASGLMLVSDVSKMMGVSREVISRRWRRLGLKFHSKKITENKHYYYIDSDELVKFLKEHPDVWDSRLVEPYAFEEEPEWLLEKRKQDEDSQKIKFREWTIKEIFKAENLLSQGKNYKEIAQEINRTELAVTLMLRSLGHSFELPKYWTYIEEDYLVDNYQTMQYKEIGKELNRTTKSVEQKAESLGLRKRKKRNTSN